MTGFYIQVIYCENPKHFKVGDEQLDSSLVLSAPLRGDALVEDVAANLMQKMHAILRATRPAKPAPHQAMAEPVEDDEPYGPI